MAQAAAAAPEQALARMRVLPARNPGQLWLVLRALAGQGLLLASLRVTVEHVIASVKRVRIVKEKIRLHSDQVRDRVMLIACGLHNLRLDHRKL